MGSRTLVHGSLDGSNKDIQGKYLNRCKVEEESDIVISPEGKAYQDRIWVSICCADPDYRKFAEAGMQNETLDVLSKVHPQLKDIVSQYLGG